MAKKSAASKGYRKTVKKKPFLTKKDIIELIVIIAIIALAVVLFNIFYDDGFISSSEIKSGDIATYGSSKIKTRYFKVGEANELEGFTRTDTTGEGNPIITYTYTPDEETDNISEITVNGSIVEAGQLVDNIISYEEGAGVDIGEKIETTIQGHDAYVIGYTYDFYSESVAEENGETEETAEAAEDTEVTEETAEAAETAEATETSEATETTEATEDTAETAEESTEATEETTEETEDQPSNIYGQAISVYVHIDDTHTLAMHITRTGDDDSFYMPEEDYLEYALKYVDVFTVVDK